MKTILSLQDIIRAWETARNDSVLRQTQVSDPLAWQAFYSRVAHAWEDMTGSSLSGADMVDQMELHGMLKTGDRVLDLGCGSGRLALSLAQRGIEVTALDANADMIEKIDQAVDRFKLRNLTTCVEDWQHYTPSAPHSLAAACFFPDAFSPEGLIRLESLSTNRCMLALGDGTEAFPLRRILWKKIMGSSLPAGGFHIPFLLEYLGRCRRDPILARLSRPVVLDVTTDCALAYYNAYFAIFGQSGSEAQQILCDVLDAYTDNGRIRIEGVSHTSLVFWHVNPDSPLQRRDG